MDLKIKDVAELLNVSETTIRRWLSDGKIPAYRLNHQYRFNRLEIENWVMSHKLGKGSHAMVGVAEPFHVTPPKDGVNESASPLAPQGSKQFSLYRAIHKGGILHDIPGQNKEEVIRNAMNHIAPNLNLDTEVIVDLLLDREALQPTALNHGLAIPHTRDFLLNAHFDLVTIAFPRHPIEYGALDGKPVHTLFFLFASNDRRHLHLLAKITHFSSQPENLRLLEQKPPKEKLLEYLKEWESDKN